MRGREFFRTAACVLSILSFAIGASRASAQAAPGAAFDRAFAPNGLGADPTIGAAGKVVNRFAPPVAAPVAAGTSGFPQLAERGSILRPCDSPGSGCRNPQSSTPAASVPPIGPGTRPPRTSPGE